MGTVGGCGGWSLAGLAACRLPVQASVCWYGGQIHEHRAETPKCPVQCHFGDEDPLIPNEQVAEIRALHPEVTILSYDAGHGFNCAPRGDFRPEAAALARERSLAFLAAHLG